MSQEENNRLQDTGTIAEIRTLNGDRGFKITEAAAILTISTRTLRREIKKGVIAAVYITPRRFMIMESEIARRINEATRSTAKTRAA